MLALVRPALGQACMASRHRAAIRSGRAEETHGCIDRESPVIYSARDYLAREAVSDASHAASLNLASLPYPSHDPGMRYGTSSDGCPQADAYGHARAVRDSVAGANSNPNHKRSTACQRHAGGDDSRTQ